ncbi:uncharacterized protein [Haliaeetus albicilla]|uniref:uncharacterized protein n=1 Tax=Haliaeetus albicilla TaxID=8969 RepID=UPI0037E9AA6A
MVVEEEIPPQEGNQAPLLGERTEPPGTEPPVPPAAPSTVPLLEWVKPSSGSFRKWREVPVQGNSDSSDEEKVDGVIRRPSKSAPQIRTEEGPNALQRVQGLLRRLEGAIQNAERMVPLMPPTQGAGDGQEGGTQKGTDWRLVAKECCLSGVQFQPDVLPIRAAARGGYEWTPFDVKTVRELASTVQAHGVNSAQVLTLFECLLSTSVAPFDVIQLMRGVLPPSLLLLFKEEWRAQCLKIMTGAQAPGRHLAGVTIEQLMGEGQFVTPQVQAQAQGMRGRDFAAVATTTLAAFKCVAAMDRADPPCVKICQGIAERFTAFLDQLQLAIQAANPPEMAKEAIVVECAKAQVNPQTAGLLSHLPAGSSLGEVIRHVLEREQQQEARPIAAALEQVLQAGPSDNNSGSNDTPVELTAEKEGQDQGNVTTVPIVPPVAQIALIMGMKTRPESVITLEVEPPLSPRSISLLALLDRGPDVTVILVHVWPPGWPTIIQGQLIGVGGRKSRGKVKPW